MKLLTPKIIVRRIRMSLIEDKILHLNEEINSNVNSPQPKIDEIIHRKRSLIVQYQQLEKK